MCGATARSISETTPSVRAGSGCSSSRTIARASRPIAVEGGGTLEWPPAARAVRRSVRKPFSATPTSASGSSANEPSPGCMIARPSSRLNQARAPRAASAAVMAPAPSFSAHLLVVPERDPHGAARPEALPREAVDRLHRADHAGLVVERAAPPHEAVGDHAREGRMRPRLGVGHRHHVEVRGQQHRLERGVAARPGVEQARGADLLALEHAARVREGGLEPVVERGEGRRVEVGRRLVRHRREA